MFYFIFQLFQCKRPGLDSRGFFARRQWIVEKKAIFAASTILTNVYAAAAVFFSATMAENLNCNIYEDNTVVMDAEFKFTSGCYDRAGRMPLAAAPDPQSWLKPSKSGRNWPNLDSSIQAYIHFL